MADASQASGSAQANRDAPPSSPSAPHQDPRPEPQPASPARHGAATPTPNASEAATHAAVAHNILDSRLFAPASQGLLHPTYDASAAELADAAALAAAQEDIEAGRDASGHGEQEAIQHALSAASQDQEQEQEVQAGGSGMGSPARCRLCQRMQPLFKEGMFKVRLAHPCTTPEITIGAPRSSGTIRPACVRVARAVRRAHERACDGTHTLRFCVSVGTW